MMSNDLIRSPTTITFALLLISSPFASAYRLPRETKTLDRHDLNVVSYPLVTATPAPSSPLQLGRRAFNTVCGYIGGDPDFPATCLAGSHCVVEVQHGAVGCCPDGGPCTEGIFTGCVDVNSPPQTVLDPYIFTCTGTHVCYKNDFDGGFYQYGCGTASHLATTVATSAFRQSGLAFSHVTVALTAKPVTLATPTTIGSRMSTHDASSSSSSNTESSSPAEATAASPGSSASGTASGTKVATALAGSKSDPSAPDQDDATRSSSSLVGGIIGGVVGGISFLVVIAMFVIFWRKRRQSDQPNAYITPDPDKEMRLKAQVLSQTSSTTSSPRSSARDMFQRPVQSLGSISSKRSSPLGLGLTLPSKSGSDRPSDEIPLTNAKDKLQPEFAPVITTESETDPYPGPRRGGGGSFWSQTRSQPRSRDRSWA